jgi:threonyl-tRNA synthetase
VRLISDKVIGSARDVVARLKAAGFRAARDEHADKLGAEIRRAEVKEVPDALVIGGKEAAAEKVAVRSRALGDDGIMPVDAYVEKLRTEVATRARPEKKPDTIDMGQSRADLSRIVAVEPGSRS